MMKQVCRTLIVTLAAGIAILVCACDSPQTSEQARVGTMQDVKKPPSEGLRIDPPAPSSLPSKDISGSGEASDVRESNSGSDGDRPADHLPDELTELTTEFRPDQLPAGEQPSDAEAEQNLNEAATVDDHSLDSDMEDYYGDEFFERAQALEDSNPEVRRQAVEDAATLRNDEAFEELLASLQDVEAQNRVTAIDSLGRLLSEGAADEEQVFNALLDATADPDPDVARSARLLIQDRFSDQNPFPAEHEQ